MVVGLFFSYVLLRVIIIIIIIIDIITSLNIHCNFRRLKCDEERSRKNIKIRGPCSRNTAHLDCNNKSDTRPTGTISESFRNYLNKIPGEHEIKELLK